MSNQKLTASRITSMYVVLCMIPMMAMWLLQAWRDGQGLERSEAIWWIGTVPYLLFLGWLLISFLRQKAAMPASERQGDVTFKVLFVLLTIPVLVMALILLGIIPNPPAG